MKPIATFLSSRTWRALCARLSALLPRHAIVEQDALETYLAQATSLPELEAMQRQWDRARGARRWSGAF